ncbi:MAG: hypothetical protein QXH80_03910 [Candidatus Nanoarchaeia archaeon]
MKFILGFDVELATTLLFSIISVPKISKGLVSPLAAESPHRACLDRTKDF